MKKKNILTLLLVIACAFVCVFAFTACGEENPEENAYTVTFSANGGKFADKDSVTAQTDKDGKVTLPATDPERTDYTFVGYNTAADGTGTAVTASTVYTKDTTVYAKWTAKPSEGEEPDDGASQAKDYYFDAEYTDLTGITSDVGSGTARENEMIKTDDGANEGYYVKDFNIVGTSLKFEINAEKATTVKMALLLTAPSECTLEDDLLVIEVNGTTVNYASATVTNTTEKVSAIKTKIVFDKIEIGDVQLAAGKNTITLTVAEKPNASGSGTTKLTLSVDAMVLSSEETLTWNPITADDWGDFYF